MKVSKGFFSLLVICLVALVLPLPSQVWAASDPMQSQTTSFKLNYRGGPDPGWRSWERKGSVWTETLPARTKRTFTFDRAYVLHNVDGVVLKRVGEPDFFVFIPNNSLKHQETGKMQVWSGRSKEPWILLGTMTEIPASFL